MNITHALYAIGAKFETKNGVGEPSKDNPYMVYIDGAYVDAIEIRMRAIAHQTIADHLDELNREH